MRAAMRHDSELQSTEHGQKFAALWSAITEALPAFRLAIIDGCKDAGIPVADMPEWL